MYMKVLLFCCKGFEMMEFSSFYDVCGWAKSEYGFDMQVDVCGFTKSTTINTVLFGEMSLKLID